MCKLERKLTLYGLPTLIQDLLIRLRPVHVSCGAAKEELGYDLLKYPIEAGDRVPVMIAQFKSEPDHTLET